MRRIVALIPVLAVGAVLAMGASAVQVRGVGHDGTGVYEVYTGKTAWLEALDLTTHVVTRLTDPVAWNAAKGWSGAHAWLTWSPDGKALAFVRTTGSGHGDVYILDIKSRQLTNVTASLAPRLPACLSTGYGRLAWAPDGKSLAFARSVRGNGSGMYVVGRRGGGATLLRGMTACDAAGGPYGAGPLAWSPDSARIAFVDPRLDGDACQNDPRLIVVARARKQTTVIPTRPALPPEDDYGYAVDDVSWSPNGTSLVYVSNSESYSESDGICDGGDNEANAIYTVALPGTASVRVAAGSGTLMKTLWSPTGGSIAFVNFTRGRLSVMDASGGDLRVLASGFGLGGWDFAWLPDGRTLLEASQSSVRVRDTVTGRLRGRRWGKPFGGSILAVGSRAFAVNHPGSLLFAPIAGGSSKTIVVESAASGSRIGELAVTLP